MSIKTEIRKQKIPLLAVLLILLLLADKYTYPTYPHRFSVYLLLLMITVQIVSVEIKGKTVSFCFDLLLIIGNAYITVFLSQYLLKAPTYGLGVIKITMAALVCLTICFALLILTKKIVFSVFLTSGFILLLSTADYFVFLFRGNELFFHDFLGLQTALNVAESYSLQPDSRIITVWSLWLIALAFAISVKREQYQICVFPCVVSLLISVFFFYIGTENVVVQRWQREGRYMNGFILNFAADIRFSEKRVPSDYSREFAENTLQQFGNIENIDLNDYPNVIVIMNESFSDFTVYENYQSNKDILSFFHSDQTNSIRGVAVSSVFGGTTANSEYEFLTGNSMNFMTAGAVPFIQYIADDTWSMVKWFKELGFYTVGMHPYYANGWNRDTVYPKLGFDRIMFLDDFPQERLLRGVVTDEELYSIIIKELKSDTINNKKFFFAVTMQNHGAYARSGWEDYTDWDIELGGFSELPPDVRDFLTLSEISDRALEYLIHEIEKYDQKTIIIIFGDHQPSLDDNFYKSMLAGINDMETGQVLSYMVPFMIWANYEIKKIDIPLTSINYLGDILFEAAGIEKPDYFMFISEIRDTIPSINSNWYYSREEGSFISSKYAAGKEREALRKYENVQYYEVFEKK